MVEHLPSNSLQQLWLVPLDGTAPQVGQSGRQRARIWLVTRRRVYRLHSSRKIPPVIRQLHRKDGNCYRAARCAGRGKGPVVRRAIASASQPDLTYQGIWYVQDSTLWLMDYETGESARVTSLPDFGRPRWA